MMGFDTCVDQLKFVLPFFPFRFSGKHETQKSVYHITRLRKKDRRFYDQEIPDGGSGLYVFACIELKTITKPTEPIMKPPKNDQQGADWLLAVLYL